MQLPVMRRPWQARTSAAAMTKHPITTGGVQTNTLWGVAATPVYYFQGSFLSWWALKSAALFLIHVKIVASCTNIASLFFPTKSGGVEINARRQTASHFEAARGADSANGCTHQSLWHKVPAEKASERGDQGMPAQRWRRVRSPQVMFWCTSNAQVHILVACLVGGG